MIRFAFVPVVAATAIACGSPSTSDAALRAAVARATASVGTVDALRRAIAQLDASARSAHATGELRAEADALAAAGDLRAQLDDDDAARASLRAAIERYTAAGDADLALRTEIELTNDDPDLDDEPLVAALTPLAARARAAGFTVTEAVARLRMAQTQVRAGCGPAALDALHALEPILGDAVAPRYAMLLHGQLGICFHNAGDGPRALEQFDRGRALAATLGDPRTAAELEGLTGITDSAVLDHPREAQRLLAHALAALERMGMTDEVRHTRTSLAKTDADLGDHAGAIAALEPQVAALRGTPDRGELAGSLAMLAQSYRAVDRLADARRADQEVLDIGLADHDPLVQESGLIGLARVDLTAGRWADAQAEANRFLVTVRAREQAQNDERLRLSYSAATRQGQAVLVDAAAGAGDATAAFLASEAMRGRYLVGALGGDRAHAGVPVATVAEAQAALDPDTTLVEYAFGALRVRAFILDGHGLVMRDLGPARPILDAGTALYQQLSDRTTPAATLAATRARLAALIIAPIAADLHGPRLALSLDQLLGWLPLAPLPLPDGALVGARFELIDVGSASVLRAQRRARPRPAPTRPLAILADPMFTPGDARAAQVATRGASVGPMVRLPATRREAALIAALVPDGRAWVALDAAASVAAARGPEIASASIVHIATHSLFDPEDPRRNGLVLAQVDAAGRPVPDGFLGADDVAQLALSAELVVLSACHTAVGTSYSGEGIGGLTRAFLQIGVPEVVSSLWQVEDASTTEFMVHFYQALLRDHLRPEAALRRAQQELAADPRFASPYHWAAFVIHGRPHA